MRTCPFSNLQVKIKFNQDQQNSFINRDFFVMCLYNEPTLRGVQSQGLLILTKGMTLGWVMFEWLRPSWWFKATGWTEREKEDFSSTVWLHWNILCVLLHYLMLTESSYRMGFWARKKFLFLYPIVSRGCYVAFEFDLRRLFVYQRYFWLIIYYSKFSSIIPLLTLAVQFTVIYLDNINLILQMNRFSV